MKNKTKALALGFALITIGGSLNCAYEMGKRHQRINSNPELKRVVRDYNEVMGEFRVLRGRWYNIKPQIRDQYEHPERYEFSAARAFNEENKLFNDYIMAEAEVDRLRKNPILKEGVPNRKENVSLLSGLFGLLFTTAFATRRNE